MSELNSLRLDVTLPRAVWQPASVMAKAYWQEVIEEEAFSAVFRAVARQALQQVAALDATIAQMA